MSKVAPSAITHDKSKHPVYSSWAATKKRCTNSKASDYASYGGKGITMCNEWLNSFETFLADMGDRPKGLILGRKNKIKGFCKENCFWGTRLEVSQGYNRAHYLTCYGETKSLADWSRDLRVIALGLNYAALRARKNQLKWSDEKTLTTIRSA
jgi:hypothetical protein